ncbi:universal stress protein [Nostoc sp. 'Lobaria pulmonaria (5183) cyanobiont']|uniref:universal stress protein n=1 Tax=Nostoc sp. 'Lobaria pulmonaria (5183) cyanobiont' TaxID=1618022 RepID=UPI000CF308D3|nr:universal stress protein [Nostoc sp. 'Lobaria pulmonaria (5183) cyanobiont']AVH72945.1 universal stress protein UspA [Nostoc sp. 'Lobaria pulmonaria (5183) cyanobiont']
MSFKKILVAVNDSPATATVFIKALELAQRDAAQLMIGYSIELAASSQLTVNLVDLKIETQQAQSLLQLYYQKAKILGIMAEYSYQTGEPGTNICDLARSWGADLIVLGRRGLKGFAELLTGSVSNHVVHHAPCSVLVVQRQ